MGQNGREDDVDIRGKRHPVFRATSPLSEERSKAKEVENYLYTSVPIGDTIETVFRRIIFC